MTDRRKQALLDYGLMLALACSFMAGTDAPAANWTCLLVSFSCLVLATATVNHVL